MGSDRGLRKEVHQEGTAGKRDLRHHQVQGEAARTYLAGANLISKVSTRPLQESATGGRSHQPSEALSQLAGPPRASTTDEAKDLSEWVGRRGKAAGGWGAAGHWSDRTLGGCQAESGASLLNRKGRSPITQAPSPSRRTRGMRTPSGAVPSGKGGRRMCGREGRCGTPACRPFTVEVPKAEPLEGT